jgi:hypothetical protein
MAIIRDSDIDVREQHDFLPTRIPIQAWNPFVNSKENVWSIGGLAKDGTWVYNFIGANDKLDSINANTPRTSVHLYEGSYVDKIGITAGEHYITKGSYAATVIVQGESILFVYGHINNLTVEGRSQVFIHEGAYIDFLICQKGGFVRIYKGANVHGGIIFADGKAEISTMAVIHDMDIKKAALVGYMPDNSVYPLTVAIRFKDKEERNKFCKDVTDEYRATHKLKIGDLCLWDVCNCYVLDNWVYFSSNTRTDLTREEIEQTIINALKLDTKFIIRPVEAWIDGVSLHDMALEADAKRVREDCKKFNELHTLERRVEELREELGIKE